MMAKKAPNPIDKHVGSRVRMRRMMLGMSQEKLGDALGLTFQQVQKYEKGTNRIGASRLQQISQILQVPVSFFFEGAPRRRPGGAYRRHERGALAGLRVRLSRHFDGLALTKAFMRIADSKLRRRIVDLVEQIATATNTDSRRTACGHRPHFAHILTALRDAATTCLRIALASHRRSCKQPTATDGLTRGVFRSATFKLSVHQRVGVGRTPGQGLRPNLGRGPRSVSRKRRQARNRRRQQGQYADSAAKRCARRIRSSSPAKAAARLRCFTSTATKPSSIAR